MEEPRFFDHKPHAFFHLSINVHDPVADKWQQKDPKVKKKNENI